MRRGGPQLAVSRLLGRIQIRAGAAGIDGSALDYSGLPINPVLRKRCLEDRGSLKDQPLRAAHHAVDDRAFEQLTPGTDHQPAETGQPAAAMQDAKKPLDILPVCHEQEQVQATGALEPLAGRAVTDAGAGRRADDAAGVGQLWQDRMQHGPKPAAIPYAVCHLWRHSLSVEIQQCKCWLTGAVGDELGRARNQVRCSLAIETGQPRRRGQLNAIRQVRSKAPERDRLVRTQAVDQSGELIEIVATRPDTQSRAT